MIPATIEGDVIGANFERDDYITLYVAAPLDTAVSSGTVTVTEGKFVTVDVVFDGPPGPNTDGHTCNFVELEDTSTGASIGLGEWIDRGNGLWALRLRVVSDER